MYCTIIKKVKETKCNQLTTISTNAFTNSISIGGVDGFVKVVNFDSVAKKYLKEEGGKIQPRYGQTLIAHKEDITILTWNYNFNKLTSCDKNGTIVVWELTKEGNWKEEMTNNRNESYVTDLKWSKQGHFLCFVFGDGHIIVGSVEGVRSWSLELKKELYLIEWSPDGSNILVAAKNNNIQVLSSSGQPLGELELEPNLKKVPISNITWWTNLYSQNRTITIEKHLLVVYENGFACLYDNERDVDPIIIKTNLRYVIGAEWNVFGEVFAVCGSLRGKDQSFAVTFYSVEGEILRILKTPEPIDCFSWDSNGTNMALQAKDSVYFALIKPKYKWCFFSNTLVYSFLYEQEHHTLIYWDVKNNTHSHKYVRHMLDITSSKLFCLITAKIRENSFLLILSNCMGTALDNKILNFEPIFISLNNTHAAVASKHYVYVWQFRALETEDGDYGYKGKEIAITLLKRKKMKEVAFFIDEFPNAKEGYDYKTFNAKKKSNDKITAICLCDQFLFVSCKSGRVLKYALRNLSSIDKYKLEIRMNKMGVSPNSQYLWGIDEINHLHLWNMYNSNKMDQCEKYKFDKRDVWSVIWSEESDFNFIYLEKNSLNVVSQLVVTETLNCNGYLAEYSKTNVTFILLEKLMHKPWDNVFIVEDIVFRLETNVLKKLRDSINLKPSISQIHNFANENDNPELWDTLSKHSLKNLDYETTEKAMIHTNDLPGLNFIKKIKTMESEKLQKAEVAQYYQKYDEAEAIYNEENRPDLALEMQYKLGNHEKVSEIMEKNGIIDDEKFKINSNNQASQFFEEKEYDKAEIMYQKAENAEGLINLWFKTEQFDKAAEYIEKIPEKNELLNTMGDTFETYGLCEESVKCYLRYGDAKKGIDTCVKLNKWNVAVELAEKNHFFETDSLVIKFGNILKEKNRKMDLVELYRKAHRHIDAAKIIYNIAEDFKRLNSSPIILKKIYVMAALEMETLISKNYKGKKSKKTKKKTVNNNIDLGTLNSSSLEVISESTLTNPWKGAEAYHFYMLCQRQLHKQKKKHALKTALRLVLYEKELNAKEVYRLIALCSVLNKSYYELSKAITKLEDCKNLTNDEREKYREFSFEIFNLNLPQNVGVEMLKCPTKDCNGEISELDINCKECGIYFSACVASGQSILDKDYFKCRQCKHKFIKKEVLKKELKNCPLCHVALEVIKQ